MKGLKLRRQKEKKGKKFLEARHYKGTPIIQSRLGKWFDRPNEFSVLGWIWFSIVKFPKTTREARMFKLLLDELLKPENLEKLKLKET